MLQSGVSILGDFVLHVLPDGAQALADAGVSQYFHQQVQAQSHHRQHQNQHDPGHLHGGVGVLAVEPQHHQKAEHRCHGGQHRGIRIELDGQRQQPDNLQQEGKRHKYDA